KVRSPPVSRMTPIVECALPSLSVLMPEGAGNPVIDADLSRSRADQPDQDDDVHGFGQIEEIVEPVEKREPCRNRRKLDRRDRDDHLDDKSRAAQARKQPDDEQPAADEFDRGDEISHEMRKGYSGAGKGFIHLAGAAGDEDFVASRNSEKHAERNAGEQDPTCSHERFPSSNGRINSEGFMALASPRATLGAESRRRPLTSRRTIQVTYP